MSDEETFRVRRYVDPTTLKRDLAYTTVDLSNAMSEQASLFAHYGLEAAKASRQVDNLKLLLENTEAAVYRKLRDEMVTNGEKITEALLDKMVSRHRRVINMKKALNEAKQIEGSAKTAVEAFRHRKDMLIQEGLISREEMKGEVVIRKREIASAAYEDQKKAVLEQRAERADTSRE